MRDAFFRTRTTGTTIFAGSGLVEALGKYALQDWIEAVKNRALGSHVAGS